MKTDEENASSASEISYQRTGLDSSLTSNYAVVTNPNPLNEFAANKDDTSPRPNSSASEMPTVKDSVVMNVSILKIPHHQMERESTLEELHHTWSQMGLQALATTLSALYGKLLVVMGIAFPMSEVISSHIPHSYYEGYYLYLYFGSMAFLLYMYAMLLKGKPTMTPVNEDFNNSSNESLSEDGLEDNESDSEYYEDIEDGSKDEKDTTRVDMNHMWHNQRNRRHSCHVVLPSTFQHYGSFYLRMGAVAFGIGSMIYSGLEFGQYFELEPATKCHNALLVLTPATRMAFIFIQMYFIFLNDEQQMRVTRHRVVAKFGLMHMIGTNLSVWLNVLVQETRHEILTFYNPKDKTFGVDKQSNHMSDYSTASSTSTHEPIMAASPMAIRSMNDGPHHIYECRRTNIIGSLVQNASPFLFPCTIEYSLICAAILYVMWKNISRVHAAVYRHPKAERCEDLITPYNKKPHYYSVDCAQAHKGLFVGILFLVLTIISLILFFVLISKKELVEFAVTEVNIGELSLYGLTTMATIVGMIQVRELKFDGLRNLELDNILLVGAQTGSFIYGTFTIISGHFTRESDTTVLVMITASTSLVQTFCQTVFILDASRRSCVTPDQIRKKPGREIVTFLLVSNLAMWAINTLEKSRADSHPIQLNFYGPWAWTIITHVSMPLAIFYRFHSTVCLCEIWKRSYKIKPSYIL